MLRIESGTVLSPTGWSLQPIYIDQGQITDQQNEAPLLNAKGLHILPGIIDIHGDGFERNIMPRPNVSFDLNLALEDTDRQLAASGITTAYLGITSSWEKGLRSVSSADQLIRQIAKAKSHFKVDFKTHVRHELYNFAGTSVALEWLSEGLVDALAFNDHTGPAFKNETINWGKLREQKERGKWLEGEFQILIASLFSQQDRVYEDSLSLAKSAQDYSVPMLSHDDRSVEDRIRYRNLGCQICEFPIDVNAAINAKDNNENIVFGAPNVIRGGSHSGNASAQEMISQNLCTILASDYYYPSLLQAPYKLFKSGLSRFEDLWKLVSLNPAIALGLSDRGEITKGQRADLIIVDMCETSLNLVATIAKGKIVYVSDYARLV
ncbi:MAG: alpha-D-ribose 1-methylphosphonate 5-triphosphate diphosphatase [Methylocystaceae bacterium]|nr:alpha-D-ribose 1-methylphosphonate 5-triphosphate diphosphatase [Methylocystaceae bacterium]